MKIGKWFEEAFGEIDEAWHWVIPVLFIALWFLFIHFTNGGTIQEVLDWKPFGG